MLTLRLTYSVDSSSILGRSATLYRLLLLWIINWEFMGNLKHNGNATKDLSDKKSDLPLFCINRAIWYHIWVSRWEIMAIVVFAFSQNCLQVEILKCGISNELNFFFFCKAPCTIYKTLFTLVMPFESDHWSMNPGSTPGCCNTSSFVPIKCFNEKWRM